MSTPDRSGLNMTASGTVGYRMQGENVLLLAKDKGRGKGERGSERG